MNNIYGNLLAVINKIFLLIITLAITVSVAEISYRMIVFYIKGPEDERSSVITNSELGWSLNTKMKDKVKLNRCGEDVALKSPTHPYIIKFPVYTNKRKILFIGDSFTHAHEVSSKSAYYDVFEEITKDKFSVYAAGVGGYGNLQEYLLLKKIYDEIQPDIIVWQLTDNDPRNNVFDLEKSTFDQNNQRIRPYLHLKSGAIAIKDPSYWVLANLRISRFILSRIQVIDWKYKLGILDFLNSAYKLDKKQEEIYILQGLLVLANVLSMAIRDYPETHFIGFSVTEKHDNTYRKIFTKEGALYFDGFYKMVESVDYVNCLPLDKHWNHKGNRIAGKVLYNYFNKNDLL